MARPCSSILLRSLSKPLDGSRAAAEIAAVKVIATAAVVVVVSGEGVASVSRKAETIAVWRSGAMVSEPEAVIIAVMPIVCFGRGREGCEPQSNANDMYKLQHEQTS
jgi:hypothetical protein